MMTKNWAFKSILFFLITIAIALSSCQKEQKPKVAFNPIYLNDLAGTHYGYETYQYAQSYQPTVEQDSILNKTIIVSPNDEYSIFVVGLDSSRVLDFVEQTDSALVFQNYISDYVSSVMIFRLTYNLYSQKTMYYFHFADSNLGSYNHQTTREFYEY